MFQRKFLKLQYKKITNKKEEITRLHPDSLRFFQNNFVNFLLKILDKYL